MEIFNKIPKWGQKALIILVISAVSILSFNGLKTQFQTLNNDNISYLEKVQQERMSLFENSINPNIQEEQKDILRRKLVAVKYQKKQYMSLISILYKNYYALLTLFPFLSGFAGITVFLLLKDGWTEASASLKVTFMSLTFITAIVGIFPEVYQQESNINRYVESYKQFSYLQKDIYNYNLTGPWIDSDSIPFDKFLINLNSREKNLIDFHLGLEKKEISQDIFELSD